MPDDTVAAPEPTVVNVDGGAPPQVATVPTQTDASPIPSVPDSGGAAAPAPAPAAPAATGVPYGAPGGMPQAGGNQSGANTPAPAAAPPKPQSMWQAVVQGALWGLAGSAGAKHFGGGLAGGAQGYMAGKQQQTENAQAQ